MQRVAIIGLGLMGGSIGLGLRAWSSQQSKDGGNALEVAGFDVDLDQQAYAKKINAVDRAEWELAKAVRDADIVVVCTPVRAMKETFADIAPLLKSGAVVTDVGSTKADVLAHALAQLHPVPDDVLMIGDRSHDVEGAAAHGIDTVVVGWGYGRDDFEGSDGPASKHVSTVDELREVLGV